VTRSSPPRAVTFDCWGTLIYEQDPGIARGVRLEALREAASQGGAEADEAALEAALSAAHHRHVELWMDGVASGSPEMARWMLEHLEIAADAGDWPLETLVKRLEEAALTQVIHALAGARETLLALRERGIRRALVCDTGFSPGRIVRRFLEQHGLLELLEVQVFSNEAGRTKPHPSLFRAALEPLGVEPADAIHVGDLRRTDVAGARGVGMASVRIRSIYDDDSEHPEADAVVDSHAHLLEILRLP
jgi:putative hydrolase of the HAD superfamily